MPKPSFTCDYLEGAHPSIIDALVRTNLEQTPGYGTDHYCEEARSLIRAACGAPDAEVHFLVGGTQTNATVIDALLRPYHGVYAAATGHIACHESGAIEASGHKVLPLPSAEEASEKGGAGRFSNKGKITAQAIETAWTELRADESWEHMVIPGMVYISQPTEYGTLYTLSELTAISEVCRRLKLPLYVDGARLAYALGSSFNDVTLQDLARLADVFYIGGTKCGALFGEAVVIPDPTLLPHFFTLIKQHGALLAKGRLLGIQFAELFKNDLYLGIGKQADDYARTIEAALEKAGYPLFLATPTNQVFTVLPNETFASLRESVDFEYWEKYDEGHTVVRFATSWATTAGQMEKLLEILGDQ